jgi:type I restriction enzyme S subunit
LHKTYAKGWEWVKLDDICYQITDGTHYTPSYLYDGVPFLSVKDVSKGYLDFRDTRLISREEHEILSARCKPEFGDVLLTKVGTTGIAVVVNTHQEFSIFVSLALLKFFQEEILPQYLSLVINSPFVKSQSEKFTMGVGNKNLVLKHIKGFSIPLPPLAEQKRIVARVEQLFAQTRALAEKLSRAQADLDALNQSALFHLLAAQTPEEFQQQWDFIAAHFERLFTAPEHIAPLRQSILELAVRGKLTRREPGDEPARELLQRIRMEKEEKGKTEDLPPVKEGEKPFVLPGGWEWCKAQELFSVQSGYAFKSQDFTTSGIRLVRNINIGHGSIDWSDIVHISREQIDGYDKFALSDGDILISLDRPIISTGLKVAQVSLRDLPSFLVQRVGRTLFWGKNTNSKYIFIWFLSSLFIDSIDPGRSKGVPHISQKDIEKLIIPLPPLAEQARIVAKVEGLLGLCDALEARLRAAQSERGRLVESVLAGVG